MRYSRYIKASGKVFIVHQQKYFGAFCILFMLASLLSACNDNKPPQTSKPVLPVDQQNSCNIHTQEPQTLYVGAASFSENPKTVTVSALNLTVGHQLWQTVLAHTSIANFQSLQVANNVIYATYPLENSDQPIPDAIAALDTKDGHQLWQYKAAPQTQINDLQICNGQMILYISNITKNSQIIEAHHLNDGSLIWNYTTSGYTGKPIVTKNTIYTVSATVPDLKNCKTQSAKNPCSTISTIHALNSIDGKEQWHSNQYTTSFGFITITATDQAVYAIYPIATAQSLKDQAGVQIYNAVDALAAASGQQAWHTQTQVSNVVNQSAVFNSTLYLGGNGLAALHITDGKILWSNPAQNGPSLQITDQGIYSFTPDPQNFCPLDAQTGKSLWCATNKNGPITASSAQAIYTAANFSGTVNALKKGDGTALWKYEAAIDHHIFGLTLA